MNTGPVSNSKAKPPTLKKVRRIQLKEMDDLLAHVAVMEAATSGVREKVIAYRDFADVQVEEYRQRMQRHLARTDLRPAVNFKPQPNNRWAVTVGADVYELGPLPGFEDIDDDDPRFYWAGPDGVRHPARSMFQALIGVVQDFSRQPEGVDTGPVSA